MLSFHHVAIQCVDLRRCERFYREVLGLPLLRRWPLEGVGEGDRSVWLEVGEGPGFLALERADPTGPNAEARPWRDGPTGPNAEARPWRDGQPGLHLLALRIAPGERRDWERRLELAGIPVVHRTRWTIYFRDPEGNRIGLSHHPADPEE